MRPPLEQYCAPPQRLSATAATTHLLGWLAATPSWINCNQAFKKAVSSTLIEVPIKKIKDTIKSETYSSEGRFLVSRGVAKFFDPIFGCI